jgi:hypothetical protein
MLKGIKVLLFLVCMIISNLGNAAAASKYQIRQDPQAVTVAQAAFAAMGGVQAVVGYQDSQATGTVTLTHGNTSVSYPITMESKGLRETRTELQMAKGTNVRIMNQGQAAIIRPDGSVKRLYSNNTFAEHVEYLPLLSVLAEIGNGNVNLIYKGVSQVQGQSDDVVELDYIPNLDPVLGAKFASMDSTLFYVNQQTKMVDKIQRTLFYEGDQNATLTDEIYLTDYRLVSGVLVPFHQTELVNGELDTDIVFSNVSFNVGLADSLFSLP